MLIASVAVEGLPYFAGGLYSYTVPESERENAIPGCRVTVPFGKGNSLRRGYIVKTEEGSGEGLKSISHIFVDEFTMSEECISLALFMSDKYLSPVYDCMRAMLPSGLELKISYRYSALGGTPTPEDKEIYSFIEKNEKCSLDRITKRFGDVKKALERMRKQGLIREHSVCGRSLNDNIVHTAYINVSDADLERYLSSGGAVIEKHREVTDYLIAEGESPISEILYMTGVSRSVIDTLIKRGILKKGEREVLRTPYVSEGKNIKTPLSPAQQKCADGLSEKLGSFNVSLLYGVTGSGKTHIFYELIDKVTEKGEGAILMVPEIMLTVQTVNRLKDRFGNKVAVIHSALSAGERLDEWKRIKRGEALIAVGTRSAVFAPFDKIGIIIMDEEQEHTYRSEMNPKYSTSAVAKQRAAHHNAMLLLASATPSVESRFFADRGKYSYFRLEGRYNKKEPPKVKTVDMRRELKDGNTSVISRLLESEIAENLKNGEQTILFINRRGYNTFVSCRACGYVEKCPNCSISLTYHIKNNRLMCHYCGYSKPAPTVCPECGSEHIRYFGAGTQKAQETLSEMFPTARILRMDADTTTQRHSHDTMLNDFAAKKYDILLGTQMVTKGLDFANVTLVGILSADTSLNSDDFRAGEKTFSLISQVVGRAGRGDKPGRAVIQTYTPDNKAINLAMTQDYDSFYNSEIALRKLMLYPPYSDICQIIVMNADMLTAAKTAEKLREMITDKLRNVNLPAVIIGPSDCIIHKMNGMYRYKILIKCRADMNFRALLKETASDFSKDKENRNTELSIDINPSVIQ